MASKELIEVIDAAALECPLCMNHFTSPKILACVHSFCLECLEKWMKKSNGVLSCPTCREVCQIPEGGLQNLKNNIFISGLLDYVTTLEQKTAPTCSLCSTAACFFCRDCDEQYCTSCRDIHAKMKISQHHRIITIEEYTVINPVEHLASKSVYCGNHNMPLHFFCGSCKVPVCVGCTLVEHPISDCHNIINIETAFESFAKLSESFINKAKENLIKFHDIAKQLKIKEELEMSNYKECEVKITEEADKAHQLIDRYKKDQLQSLESSHRHNLKLISANESEVELAIAKFSSTQGIARTLIHSPNHAMALRSSSDVSKRMDELVEQDNISDDILSPNLVKYKNTRFEVKTVDILHGDDDYEAIMTLPKASLKTEDRSRNWFWKDLAKLWTFNKDTNQWKEHEGDVVRFAYAKSGKMEMVVLKFCVSHIVTADSEMKAMQSSGHAWVWSEAEMKKYALVFKEPQFARKIKDDFEKYKKLANEVVTANEKQQTKKQPKKPTEKSTGGATASPRTTRFRQASDLPTSGFSFCKTSGGNKADTTAIKPGFSFGSSWQPTTVSDRQPTSGISVVFDSTSKEVQQKALPDTTGVDVGKSMTFADKFKPKAGTWTCEHVNNPPDTVKCLNACATFKPGAAPPQLAAAPTKPSGATGFRFDGLSSSPQTSKFSFGGGDKFSEKSAVSPNFTYATRLESAKEAEHTPVFTPSASFGSKSDASGKPQTVTSGFSFGGGNIFTPVSTNPASTSSIQFSQTSSIFNQPAAQPTGSGPFSQLVAATGFKGLNSNSTKEPTTTSPFAGLSLGAQTPPTAAPQPREPTKSSLFSGQESVVSSLTSKSREEDDVIWIYERKPTPAQIAMALKLKLPPTFYLYEYKEPCPGCIGCDTDIDLGMLYKKENKVFKDATQASTTILQDPKPTQECKFSYGRKHFFDDDDEDAEERKQIKKQEEEQEERPGNTEHNTAAAAPPKLTFSFGMDFASAVRKTMSEDKDKPSSIFSPEKNSGSSPNKSSDQGFYPEEERDDLHFKPVVTLQEVEVKTGEEEEEQLFCQRAKLFRWNRDESQWKDRGVGEIKILKHKVLNRCRILMRRDQVLKICANHIITPEMELKPNAGSDRSLVWNAMDASEMEPQLEQLAVRFKTSDITSEFKSVFEKCQKSPAS